MADGDLRDQIARNVLAGCLDADDKARIESNIEHPASLWRVCRTLWRMRRLDLDQQSTTE